MTDYYVVHVGCGTDGGFGDYAPPRWSPEPVEVDGRTVWFSREAEAREAVEALNKASSAVFPYVQYGGEFPVEYEYRKITSPQGAACDVDQAVALVTAAHGAGWSDSIYDDCDSDEDVP